MQQLRKLGDGTDWRGTSQLQFMGFGGYREEGSRNAGRCWMLCPLLGDQSGFSLENRNISRQEKLRKTTGYIEVGRLQKWKKYSGVTEQLL